MLLLLLLGQQLLLFQHLETLLLSSCQNLEELPQQMEKLINLRHLDISATPCLKTLLHPSKLKSIHVLLGAKFLLGDRSGSRTEDFGELHNLYGSLSILELENVADRREALKANMRGKEHIEKLSLEWSESIADSSQIERDILGELHPNPNIKELAINGYRGTNFPNWLADYSFSELVELSLSNCKDCYPLPALGQLPSLKFLTISGMHQITEVTDEFYGSSSSKKPFNSLERLEFDEMLEWKKWHVLGNGEEFPTLQHLSIVNCPKLIGKLPENLCSLTKLTISNCPELNLETPIEFSSLKKFKVEGSPKVGVLFDDAELFLSQLQGMKQIVELRISDCQTLTSLPFSSLPNTLKEIRIKRCAKLKLESSVGDVIFGGSNMFLEKLELEKCDSINEISAELVPQARYLTVQRCNNLTGLLIPNRTEELQIEYCENLEILSVAQMTSLRTLDIIFCKKLKSLPEHMQELLPFLKELTLYKCPEIESFPEGGLPFNLEVLGIWICKKLVNGRKEWGLQRLPCLTKLDIKHDGSDEEIPAGENWELPSSIRTLFITNLKTLSSQVLKSLTSLESLSTCRLPQIQSLLEEGLPSSLSQLLLYFHDELHSLPTDGLRRLTSLQYLMIYECNQLKSIPESALPCSLSKLVIHYCPKLKSLPVKGMPSSISTLWIRNCPLLKSSLEFEKGDYWPKIALIPTIKVNEEYL
uniref:Disease resistance protein At3g14460 n=1 Tax=Nicotiana sylvestris TaxID=4096 RepID=A0A1U7W0B9_NICSY|nr:PREDICTED: putative disease resistance protein At3g14460 [Nicotiana sylvestris]